jgi:ADP-ribosyl-[dinitrogen reductase] hydrolase
MTTTPHPGAPRSRAPKLSAAQLDRAVGVLLGTAAGDALGAGYEFGPPLPESTPVGMVGGGSFGWAPGEWTDDTSMALVIAQAAATGTDLRDEAARDQIAAGWAEWAQTAPDVGNQTRAVLSAARRAGRNAGGTVTAEQLRVAAQDHHERTGRSGGNGSLMRTAPVAVAYLHDEDGLVEAATGLSALTHHDPEAGEACVLWCLAIRHAVLTGQLDVRVGFGRLAPARRTVWAERLDQAETTPPAGFTHNGWVVEALQGAWSAISGTPVPTEDPANTTFRVQHLQLALEAAVRGGRDTDTVAAIAGGLLGAAYGASAVPAGWRRILHGWWPRNEVGDLVALGTAITTAGRAPFDGDYTRFSGVDTLTRHPYDEQVWLGGINALRTLPPGVDAVVSLCRIGPDDTRTDLDHVQVRLIDNAEHAENPNLGFVLHDAVTALEQLRAEGRTVLLHCVQAQSRTPTVAALYGARRNQVSTAQALAEVQAVLPDANPNPAFRAALRTTDDPR